MNNIALRPDPKDELEPHYLVRAKAVTDDFCRTSCGRRIEIVNEGNNLCVASSFEKRDRRALSVT